MDKKEPSAQRVVRCRRIDATRTVEEHLSCPYCFGKAAQVQPDQHERFCDYDPATDPVVYGFPTGTKRSAGG